MRGGSSAAGTVPWWLLPSGAVHDATICVRCGEVLQRRTDDGDAAVFERRVRDYEARVEPVIAAWARADLPLIRLDGTRDVDAIASELLDEVARLDRG